MPKKQVNNSAGKKLPSGMIANIKDFFHKAKSDLDLLLLGLLVFFLPFERLPSKDIFGVTIRASLIVGGIIILRVVYLLITKKLKFKWNWLYIVLALFVGWIFLIIPESINLKRALSISIFNSFVIVLSVATSLLYKKEYLSKLIVILLSSAVIMSVFAMYQFFGDTIGLPGYLTGVQARYNASLFGFPRVQAASLEPLYFGSYLLLPTMIVLGMLITGYRNLVSSRLLYTLAFIFCTIIFITVARGAIFGLLVGFVAMVVMALFKKSTNFKKIGLVFLTILISFTTSYLLINYASKLPIDVSKTFGKKGGAAFTQQLTSTGFEGDGDERAKSREKALNILNENKSAYILGVGPGQYGVYVTNNQQEYYGWPIVNNLTLELLVETGIVGLVLILTFFVGLMWRGYTYIENRAKNIHLESIVALGIVAYFASQALQFQTFSSLYIMQVWVAAGLLIGLSTASKRVRGK